MKFKLSKENTEVMKGLETRKNVVISMDCRSGKLKDNLMWNILWGELKGD